MIVNKFKVSNNPNYNYWMIKDDFYLTLTKESVGWALRIYNKSDVRHGIPYADFVDFKFEYRKKDFIEKYQGGK